MSYMLLIVEPQDSAPNVRSRTGRSFISAWSTTRTNSSRAASCWCQLAQERGRAVEQARRQGEPPRRTVRRAKEFVGGYFLLDCQTIGKPAPGPSSARRPNGPP